MGTTLIDEPGRQPRGSRTTLAGPPAGRTRLVAPPAEAQQAAGGRAPAGPVTGWLVVIEGPGKGRSIELGYGMNIIGRGETNRVVLDFGDDQISQDDHFRIAYDDAARQFHLVPGRGTNLVYVEGAPLLTPLLIGSGSDIKVGGTTLRFVALCGGDWSWPSEA